LGTVDVVSLDDRDLSIVQKLIEKHIEWTGSPKGKQVLAEWESSSRLFKKVFPKEYRKILELQKEAVNG
jgi:glutamate synthase domain-containing protein 3